MIKFNFKFLINKIQVKFLRRLLIYLTVHLLTISCGCSPTIKTESFAPINSWNISINGKDSNSCAGSFHLLCNEDLSTIESETKVAVCSISGPNDKVSKDIPLFVTVLKECGPLVATSASASSRRALVSLNLLDINIKQTAEIDADVTKTLATAKINGKVLQLDIFSLLNHDCSYDLIFWHKLNMISKTQKTSYCITTSLEKTAPTILEDIINRTNFNQY